MRRVLLCAFLCFALSGAMFAQSAGNPFVYSNANDQLQSCYGIASRNPSHCSNVSDFNDRQMCAGLAASSQDPCRSMTDRNLQLTCYGMAFAPSFPSNCRDITDAVLRDFCFSASSWGSSGNCSGVSNAADKALCQALTYRNASYCAAITNASDRQFCAGVSVRNSSACGPAVPSVSAGGPYTVKEGESVAVAASGAGTGASYEWDLDGDGAFETSGQSATFSAAALDGPGNRQIGVQVRTADGQTATAQATVSIVNVAPAATFNAPATASQGGTINLSLSAPVDVAADLATLRYAFDCGSGYGSPGAVQSASCPASNSSTAIVRGKVLDKDGGIGEYTASVAVITATVPPDPFSAPVRNDSTFVVDGLDTGCSTSGDRSLTFSIPVGRVVGERSSLIASGWMQSTAVLKMTAFDVDFAGGNGINPERDRVYFNGKLVPTEFLTGESDTWKLNTFTIPANWVEFPAEPRDGQALVPRVNTVRIDIDTGNTETLSCTSIGWAAITIRAARPVLLVHGFNSTGAIWNELWVTRTRLKGLIHMGIPAATIDIGKLASIQDNSAKIGEAVEMLLQRWGVDRINIVAHSKGGLDSRHYIEKHDKVATLAQMGTPNRGATLATLARLVLVKYLASFVPVINAAVPALADLSVERMALYNLFHDRNPRTRYVSLAGEYRFTGFFSFIPNGILTGVHLGANDVVVPAWSAHGLSYTQNLTQKSRGSDHQAYHMAQHKSENIFNQLIPFLKIDSTPPPSSGNPSLFQSAAMEAGAYAQEYDGEHEQDSHEVTTTKTIVDSIRQGQTRVQSLYVDGEQPIGLMLYHSTGDLSLTLISPSGIRVDPAIADTNPSISFETLSEEDGLRIKMYTLQEPEVGTWILEVSAPSVVNPSGEEPYSLTGVLTHTPVTLEAATDRWSYHRGEPIIIYSTLQNDGSPITAASVTVQVLRPDRSLTHLALTDDGAGDDQVAQDGVYSGRLAETAQAGVYDLVVSATGPAASPFDREKLIQATVSASASRFNSLFSDAGEDTDADGLLDDLVIDVGMDVTEPRSYRMLGELADINGTLITTATAAADLNAGAETVTLRFDGASIYRHGVDGPYLLRVVRVAEDDGAAILPLDEIRNAYTTASYDHRQFQHAALAALDQSVITDEDAPVDLTLGAESADSAALSFSVVTAPSRGLLTGTAPQLTYTPEVNFNGTDVFTFSVNDGTGDSELATVIVTVNPVNDPPVLAPIADHALDEGTIARVTLSASDLDGDALKLTLTGAPAFAALTDHGDGTGTIVLTPGFSAGGIYRPTLTVEDGGSSATATFTLTVNNINRSPVADAGGPYTANEGDRSTLDASRSADPDGDGAITRYEWDLDNDGAYDDAVGITTLLVFGDQGVYPVGLRVTDDQGAQATATAQVIVANVAPTVGAIQAPVGPSAVKTTFDVSASFSDPGTRDTHTALWDWNDGTTSAGTILEGESSRLVTGTHAYATAGVYAVKLTVTDKDGGASTVQHQYLVVYDPEGGFVTGGGWLTSPAGAYPADPALTGRANFGFVSRYKTGATVPTGQTQFQFHAANLAFHSDTYEWLVVAGARAQYKGVGKINGTGGYGFLITAVDGQINGGGGVDRLRVKIWDTASGRIVYDNQVGAADDATPATSIQGGAIVIHSR